MPITLTDNYSAPVRREILLCGSAYGGTYVPALYQTKHLRLAAILANGSRRSITLAEQAGVPLLSGVEQLEQMPDAAIVALGGELGFDVAKQLLSRNVPVLLEHPVKPEYLRPLLEISEAQGICLNINSHFSELPASAEFIAVCQKLNQLSQPLVINVSCNSRTLFSTLDILLRAFDGAELNSISITALGEHYRAIQLNIGAVPCLISYQRWRHEQDDSTDAPLGHQLSVTYPEGVACLTGTFGPFYWYPLLAASSKATHLYTNGYELERKIAGASVQDQIIQWRLKANINALDRLLNACDDPHKVCKSQSGAYLMQLSDSWHSIFTCVGFKVVPQKCTKLTESFKTVAGILKT